VYYKYYQTGFITESHSWRSCVTMSRP